MTKQTADDNIRLIIPHDVERKLNHYVQATNTEIAGFGKVHLNEEGDIVVDEVMIYEQEVTGVTADLSTQAVAKFVTDLIKRGESPADWKLWWHSHVDMSAYFSGTDTGTIDASSEFEWLVSLVVNKRRERKARLDTYTPFRFVSDLAIYVDDTIPADIALEVSEKLTLKTYKKEPAGFKNYGTYPPPPATPPLRAIVSPYVKSEEGMDYEEDDTDFDAQLRAELGKGLGGVTDENEESETVERDPAYGTPKVIRNCANADDYDTREVIQIIANIDQQMRDLESLEMQETPGYRDLKYLMGRWYSALSEREDIPTISA